MGATDSILLDAYSQTVSSVVENPFGFVDACISAFAFWRSYE